MKDERVRIETLEHAVKGWRAMVTALDDRLDSMRGRLDAFVGFKEVGQENSRLLEEFSNQMTSLITMAEKDAQMVADMIEQMKLLQDVLASLMQRVELLERKTSH